MTWSILEKYFDSDRYCLTRHHIDSYNDFVANRIKNTIKLLNSQITTVKKTDSLTHEINVYIGGEAGDNIQITTPTIVSYDDEGNTKSRIMYPNEARMLDLTYKFDIYADIVVKYTTFGNKNISETKVFPNELIGSIPIMLHSDICVLNHRSPELLKEMGECIYDQGGYFVINGKEKVIVAQERIATNRLFVKSTPKDDKFDYEGLIRCTSEANPLFPKTIRIYKYRTRDDIVDEKKRYENLVKANAIEITLPNINVALPLFIIFRAFGVESDRDIINHILYDETDLYDFLRPCVMNSHNVTTQEQAYEYISAHTLYKDIEHVKFILLNDFFPNVGNSLRSKALFLGHIINKFIKTSIGAVKETDRDSYIYKRVDISGFQMANLFRDYYNQFKNTIKLNIDQQYYYGPWKGTNNITDLVNKSNFRTIFKPHIITDGIMRSMKGSWGVNMTDEKQDLDSIKQGIVQDLSRISFIGCMSHLRRVNTPMDPTAKIVEPHRLHPSQWGVMCPCESPDGASIGLLKNMAIMCTVTYDSDPTLVYEFLHEKGMPHCIKRLESCSLQIIHNEVKVFLNNNWLGMIDNPENLYKVLKLLKRNAIIDVYTSVSWDVFKKEIHVLTEAGRCSRPLLVVLNGTLLVDADKTAKTWEELTHWREKPLNYESPFSKDLSKYDDVVAQLEKLAAPIEYVDVEEASLSYIATYPDSITKHHTYCEIHPSTILSVVTQQIPLANHNQAPRNIFSGAQGKQAIGCYATNYNNRIDTMSYILHYPQKSIVNTRFMEYLNMNKLPNGENLILAMMTYSGYNMEDAIILNKTSVERGMFNITYFKNVVSKEESNIEGNEKICFGNIVEISKHNNTERSKDANYTYLDDNGFPKLESKIKEGDVYLGRVKVTETYKDDDGSNIFAAKEKDTLYSDRSMVSDKTLTGKVDKVFVFDDENDIKTCKIRFRKYRTPELGDKLCSRHAQKGVVGMLLPQENMPFTKDGIVPDIIINPHAIPSRMTIAHLLEMLLGKAGSIIGETIDGTPFCNQDYTKLYDQLEEAGMDRYGNEIMYNGMTGEQINTEIFMGPIFYERLKHMVQDKINYRRTGRNTLLTRQPVQGRSNGGALALGGMERDCLIGNGLGSFIKEAFMDKSDKYQTTLQNGNCFVTTGRPDPNWKVQVPYAYKLMMHELLTMGVTAEICLDDIEEEDAFEDNDEIPDNTDS